MIAHMKDKSFTDMTVPKLTSDNFEESYLDFQGADRRKVGLYGLLLDYLFCPNEPGNYYAVWN